MAWRRRGRSGARMLSAAVSLSLALAIPVVGSAGAAVSAAPALPAAGIEENLEPTDCPVEVSPEYAARVTCGVLVVPERRTPESDPERTLELPVAIISSTSDAPAADPLVFPTSGGPGEGSLDMVGYFLYDGSWATADRDVIIIEQRGDALAEPTLDCPELAVGELVDDGVLLSGEAASARRAEQVTACRDRLIGEGVDLAAYTSAESAADLADLRIQLGYVAWNLYGISYGSRLAMTTMRDRPQGLRAVILDAVDPPHLNSFETLPTSFSAALDALFAQCAADVDCAATYPDLERSLLHLLDAAEQDPFTVVVKDPGDGSPITMEIGASEVAGGVFEALYDPLVVGVLPYLIDQLAQGRTDGIEPLAQRSIGARDEVAEGLDFSIDCAEEAPFNDDARIEEARAADPLVEHFDAGGDFRSDCTIWAVPPLGVVETQPVASGIPTLLMSGGYDPITPSANAEAAAAHLSHHYRYDFPTRGHGSVLPTWIDECPASIAQQFLLDPLTEPDSSCIAAMPDTEFLTTDDIHPTTAIYRLNSEVIELRQPVQLGVAGIALLILAATLVYAIVYGISWLSRRRGSAPDGAVLVAGAGATLYLAFAAGLAFVVMTTNPLILAFGVPPASRALVIIPLVAMALTILLIVVVVRAWIIGDGTLFHRVALSIAAAGCVVFAVWLVVRGLLIF